MPINVFPTTPNLQNVLDTAPINEIIIFSSGDYNLTNVGLVINQPLTLLGKQHGVSAVGRNSLPESVLYLNSISGAGSILNVKAKNVIIDGFTIGKNTNTTVNDVLTGVFSGAYDINNGLYNATDNITGLEIKNNIFAENNLSTVVFSLGPSGGDPNFLISQNSFRSANNVYSTLTSSSDIFSSTDGGVSYLNIYDNEFLSGPIYNVKSGVNYTRIRSNTFDDSATNMCIYSDGDYLEVSDNHFNNIIRVTDYIIDVTGDHSKIHDNGFYNVQDPSSPPPISQRLRLMGMMHPHRVTRLTLIKWRW